MLRINRNSYAFTSTLCPNVYADLGDTLLAPVPGVCLVGCKAVTIDKAGVFLSIHTYKRKIKLHFNRSLASQNNEDCVDTFSWSSIEFWISEHGKSSVSNSSFSETSTDENLKLWKKLFCEITSHDYKKAWCLSFLSTKYSLQPHNAQGNYCANCKTIIANFKTIIKNPFLNYL